jgi:hypothetical protein
MIYLRWTLACLLFLLPQYAKTLTNPFNPGIHLSFVHKMPEHAGNRILIISSRYFKPEKGYAVNRGLQPKYKLFYFVGGFYADSCYLIPFENMTEAIRLMDHNLNFLVYTDGHGKTFTQILERGLELSQRYTINTVLFDWPTDYIALRKTVYVADEVSFLYAKTMREFDTLRVKYFQACRVSAIFHSMGNHILKNLVTQNLLKDMPAGLFDNIIINAAAVKQHNHARWVDKLNIQQRIYITVNDEDRPLRGATLLRLSRQLGLGYSGKPAKNAIYVNFNEVAGTEHNLFLGKSETEKVNVQISDFYMVAFQGLEVDFNGKEGFTKRQGKMMEYEAEPLSADLKPFSNYF